MWLPASNGANVKGDEGCTLSLRPGQMGLRESHRAASVLVGRGGQGIRSLGPETRFRGFSRVQRVALVCLLSLEEGPRPRHTRGLSDPQDQNLQSLERIPTDPALTQP